LKIEGVAERLGRKITTFGDGAGLIHPLEEVIEQGAEVLGTQELALGGWQ
jgi:hypothetical protein